MENKVKLALLALLCMNTFFVFGQESVNTSGGDISSSTGAVSYSVGQSIYGIVNGTGGSMTQGVQQPYKVVVSNVGDVGVEINLSILPNPTSDFLHLTFEEYINYKASFQLIEGRGNIIQKALVQNMVTSLDLSALASGIYYLQVATESEIIKSFKIIKR